MFLDQIKPKKQADVEKAKSRLPLVEIRARLRDCRPPRGFLAALQGHARPRIISEMKRASPSRGTINSEAKVAERARAYQKAGAAAMSVLTDPHHFGGSLEDLRQARAACRLPLLRKDFTVDPYQIFEARLAGADAILLIVAMVDDDDLKRLHEAALEAGVDALVEVHTEDELQRAIALGVSLVGVNNRDLKSLKVSLDASRRLLPAVPSSSLAVCESGIRTPEQVREMWALGARAYLVGEALMDLGEDRIGDKMATFTGALLP